MYRLKQILFLSLVILLILPAFQKELHFCKVEPLHGAVSYSEKPSFSFESWFTGNFQVQYDKYLEDHIGFRPYLVRLHNQLDYSLFDELHGRSVVIGKEGYLYETSYIDAYTGKDFIGQELIADKASKVKYLQDTLRHMGVTLIPVFAPGKASFFPEYIPDSFKPEERSKTNIEAYREEFDKRSISFIDMNSWFLQMKDTATYPLYSKCGIHWSYYGISLVFDTLTKYMEKEKHINMVDFYVKDYEITDNLRDDDYDLARGMNLLCKYPCYEMAYPNYVFPDSPEYTKPTVMTISDSYYWTPFGKGLTKYFFERNTFRYYNKQAFEQDGTGFTDVKTITLEDDLNNYDFIMLIYTDATLQKFASGFVEDAYFILKHKDLIKYYKQVIRNSPDWPQEMQKKAAGKEVSLDEMVHIDAIWLTEQKLKKQEVISEKK